MEAAGTTWVLFIVQLFNFALLIAWIILAVFALMRLRRAGLSQGVTLGWAALIILAPILGAGAFLITRHNRRA